MNGTVRTGVRVLAVSVLAGGALPLGPAVHADNIRTETKLAGFSVSVQASPVLVLLDDPKAEVPRPTGTAVIEGDPNFTLAEVSAGPNARAVASTLWPGNLFGEGLAQVAPGAPAYPLKAESRYPDKPYTASGVDGGTLTNSSAMGLDATATADGTPTNKPGQVTIGGGTSTSTATVTDKDVAVGTAFSAVHDVNLLGGIIHIGNVTTQLTTSSDGLTPTSSGSTTVSGLTINGVGYSVDDKGVHVGPQGGALPPLTGPSQLADLGISIKGIVQASAKDATSATRSASGLVIRVDTAALRKALKPVTGQVSGPYAEIVSRMPAEAQGQLYYLFKATPSITFVFGAGSSSSAATQPISFTFPPTGFPGPGGITGPAPGGLVPGGPVPPGLSVDPPFVGTPGGAGPVLQPPGTSNAAATTQAASSGIGALWVLGALVGSGLIGWALLRFLGLAGGVLGLGCRLGAPTSVPNLRSVTA
ncbi:MAG: choice-of-anchor P family protein [Mycobacteriales bacterium]